MNANLKSLRAKIREGLRWEAIKRLQPSPGRFFHVSQKIVEGKNGPYLVGVTYNVGRNKAKRQAREAAKFRLVPGG